jgi:YHS domain-containing protein
LLKDGSRILVYNENVQEDGKSYNKIVLNRIQNNKTFAQEIKMERSMAGFPVLRSFGEDNIAVAWTSNNKVYYHIEQAKNIMMAVVAKPANTLAQINDLSNIKLAGSVDLVCKMPLSLSPGDTTFYKGKVYGFCSDVCKNHFLKKPEAFAAK